MQRLRVKGAARRLGVSTKTIHRRCDDGRLPFERVSARGGRRFLISDVDVLLTASVIERLPDGSIVEVAGPFVFDARLAQARMQRQREQAKHLKTLIDRIELLRVGRENPALRERQELLRAEACRVWAARDALQGQLAHHAARWATGLAAEHGCHALALEDLRSLEPRLRGAGLRDRLNHQVRGILAKHLTDKAMEAGLKTIIVNPRSTSSHCPRCGSEHKHVKAPDRTEPGRGWAYCEACASSLDRDAAASLRIGAKALSDPKAEDAPRVRKRPRARSAASSSTLTSRSRPEGVSSRAAAAPATRPVRRNRGTHLARTTLPYPGLALTRASHMGKKVQLN